MNIYLVKQSINNGYDTYDSMIVMSKTEERARDMHPEGVGGWTNKWSDWIDLDQKHLLSVSNIGVTKSREEGVVLTSYNAG